MATEKICDVCLSVGADTVVVALSAINLSGLPVGTSQGMDLCPAHRAQGIATMNAQVAIDIEAAIAA
jgi:hypothetical protein